MIRADPLENTPHGRALRPSRIGIVGGGTAGLLTALALKEWKPELEVVLIESSKIPIIGVGEATTVPIVPFLFGYLGIDPHRFERAVEPTFKLGTRFEWGLPEPYYFNAAFGDGDLVDAQAHDRSPLRYSMTSQLMSADRAPLVKVGDRLIPLLKETRFAWHLDQERLVRFLQQRARDVGVVHLVATIADVFVHDGQVLRVRCDDGRDLSYDLWVDCSGFRSLLLGQALDVPFESFTDSLQTDTIVTCVRDNGGRPRPYTTATTLQAGWCWTIPMRGEDHHGYVHSSRFLSPEGAAEELEKRFPGARDFKTVSFKSGRRRDFIAGNVVGIGNAYGFVEPLQSTAVHMIIIGISRLLGLLESGGRDAHKVSAGYASHWDWLRWFLALHYRFNRRIDSPFWREVHLTTDWSGLEETVRDFVSGDTQSQKNLARKHTWRDSVFGPRMMEVMLVGQGIVPEQLTPATSPSDWREVVAMRDAVVTRALTQAESWSHLRDDPALLDALVHDDDSWVHGMSLDMQRAVSSRGRSQASLAFWTREFEVAAVLRREAAKMPDDFPQSPNIDFGKYIRKVPEVVLRPRDQGQLADCLAMCVHRRLPIRLRGAGHSSGGQTLADEGAVIDLRWLKRIVADAQEEQRIRVEAGLWWLELCGHLRGQGRRPLVLTDNWRVTIGGTLAVGGFGDSTHREGLQIGGVREMIVMTLDGMRHRVKPGDDLFDWSLAGRGQLAVITEVVLETTTRGYQLEARVLSWPGLDPFLADARVCVAEQRFDWLRARLTFAPGGPVAALAGHLAGPSAVSHTAAADFEGLGAIPGEPDAAAALDLFEQGAEPPDERWLMASPGVELALPDDARGIAALHEIVRRVAGSEVARYLPHGSSIMALPGMPQRAGAGGREARFPMAPLPEGEMVVLLSIRPEVSVADAKRFVPFLQSLADIALEAGGKLYLTSIEPTLPDWLRVQLGPQRYRQLRALKAKWDPDGLLNPGLV